MSKTTTQMRISTVNNLYCVDDCCLVVRCLAMVMNMEDVAGQLISRKQCIGQCTWTANTTDTAADAAGGDDDATKLILMTLMLKSS